MKGVMRALPHISLILGFMLIALNVADYFNGSMGFLTGGPARVVMLALSIAAMANAIVLLALQRGVDATEGSAR